MASVAPCLTLLCLLGLTFLVPVRGRRLPDIPDILIRNVQVIETTGDTDADSADLAPENSDTWSWDPLGALGPDPSHSQGHSDLETPEEQIQGLSMEELEALIDAYGLHNLTSSGSADRFLLEMYHKLQEGEDLPRAAGHTYVDAAILRADTVRSLPATDADKSDNDKKVTLTFDLSTISQREVTQRAELRLRPMRHRRRHTGTLAEFRARVTVYDGETRVKRLTYHIKADKMTTDGFAVLDLTHIVKAVVDEGFPQARIEITLKQLSLKGSRQKRSAHHMPSQLPMDQEDAMLVVFTRDKHFFENFRHQTAKKHLRHLLESGDTAEVAELSHLMSPDAHIQPPRHKRSQPRNTRDSSKDCQVKDLYIDFNKIGWDEWIVYPKRFNAKQCSGKCPLPVPQSYSPTNHAVLQSLMRLWDKKSTVRPCCVPSKLGALSMLYYENDIMVVRHHENMIVDKCGCR